MTKVHKSNIEGAVAVKQPQSRNIPLARFNESLHKQQAAVLAMSYKIHRLFKCPPFAGSKAVVSSYGANKLNLPPTESLTAQQSPRLRGPWETDAHTRIQTKSSPLVLRNVKWI